jgi:hypothetical protein
MGMVARSLALSASIALVLTGTAPDADAAHVASSRPPAHVQVGPNVDISLRSGNEDETSIAINQKNLKQIVAVSNIGEGIIGPVIYEPGLFHSWSTDGGRTWKHDMIADNDLLGYACCDGSLTSDEFGNIFLTWADVLLPGVPVGLSIDGGATFRLIALIPPIPAGIQAGLGSVAEEFVEGDEDRTYPIPAIGGDQPTITAGHGSVWVTYMNFQANLIEAAGAAVTGLGQVGRFGLPQSPPSHNVGNLGDIAVGPEGQVLMVYQDIDAGEGQATIYEALDPDGLGPKGFEPARAVQTTNVGARDSIPAQKSRAIFAEAGLAWDRSGGRHQGRVYLLYTSESPDESDNTDIQVRYSDDDGATWSKSLRVNDDPGRNSQFFPRFAVDQTTGKLAAAWYDARNDRGNGGVGDTNGTPNDDAMTYGAVSVDGGRSFSSNFRISKGASNSARSGGGLEFGDYQGLAFHAGTFFYLWADNSNSAGRNPDGTLSKFDLYTARVRVL